MHTQTFEDFLRQMRHILSDTGSSPIMTAQEINAAGRDYTNGCSASCACDTIRYDYRGEEY